MLDEALRMLRNNALQTKRSLLQTITQTQAKKILQKMFMFLIYTLVWS